MNIINVKNNIYTVEFRLWYYLWMCKKQVRLKEDIYSEYMFPINGATKKFINIDTGEVWGRCAVVENYIRKIKHNTL